MAKRKATPVTRLQWHEFYVKRFNKDQWEHSAVLAMWYLLLHLGLDEGDDGWVDPAMPQDMDVGCEFDPKLGGAV